MTPKEKARDLFNKFYIHTDGFAKENAKKFALIAIDELIYFGDTELLSSCILDGEHYCDVDFFIEVRKEIESL